MTDAAATAWADFCTRLAALGQTLPEDPAARADGVRHLARQAVMALQGHLEHGDPAHPSFHRYEEPWVQWGGPNPDNVYLRAPIDPAATYRLWGDVTGVREAIFSLVEGDMHLGAFGVWSEKTLSELTVGDDGAPGGLDLPRRAPRATGWPPTRPPPSCSSASTRWTGSRTGSPPCTSNGSTRGGRRRRR